MLDSHNPFAGYTCAACLTNLLSLSQCYKTQDIVFPPNILASEYEQLHLFGFCGQCIRLTISNDKVCGQYIRLTISNDKVCGQYIRLTISNGKVCGQYVRLTISNDKVMNGKRRERKPL